MERPNLSVRITPFAFRRSLFAVRFSLFAVVLGDFCEDDRELDANRKGTKHGQDLAPRAFPFQSEPLADPLGLLGWKIREAQAFPPAPSGSGR